jgi:hypothetical protein
MTPTSSTSALLVLAGASSSSTWRGRGGPAVLAVAAIRALIGSGGRSWNQLDGTGL